MNEEASMLARAPFRRRRLQVVSYQGLKIRIRITPTLPLIPHLAIRAGHARYAKYASHPALTMNLRASTERQPHESPSMIAHAKTVQYGSRKLLEQNDKRASVQCLKCRIPVSTMATPCSSA